ncbi:TPA: 50S ribosomal protein L19 [Candidatus Peribacteria bacterium]|jgi:large subunit ribosomal protein L19|nr:50S ribosomal protein L19 [Candidatus Peribacteria bacterium]|tara:strand:+ start:1906 stop:2475 length:570 start_codon:yes stop_codon:yes gene_type:complete
MTSQTVREQSASQTKPRPDLRPGYTVRVHEKIKEGSKERIQIFEGLVISMHKGKVPTDTTFTVRRIVSGVGVERVFPLHSAQIVKIEVKKVAKVRRAKLFFLRGRHGKAARLSERFTTAEEFSIAAQNQSSAEADSGSGQATQDDQKEEAEEAEVSEEAEDKKTEKEISSDSSDSSESSDSSPEKEKSA